MSEQPTDLAEVVSLSDAALERLVENGTSIASQQWRSGSWCNVYEHDGRYFTVDEVGMMECDDARSAFEQAGIGRDIYDEISDLSVAPEYQHLIDD